MRHSDQRRGRPLPRRFWDSVQAFARSDTRRNWWKGRMSPFFCSYLVSLVRLVGLPMANKTDQLGQIDEIDPTNSLRRASHAHHALRALCPQTRQPDQPERLYSPTVRALTPFVLPFTPLELRARTSGLATLVALRSAQDALRKGFGLFWNFIFHLLIFQNPRASPKSC